MAFTPPDIPVFKLLPLNAFVSPASCYGFTAASSSVCHGCLCSSSCSRTLRQSTSRGANDTPRACRRHYPRLLWEDGGCRFCDSTGVGFGFRVSAIPQHDGHPGTANQQTWNVFSTCASRQKGQGLSLRLQVIQAQRAVVGGNRACAFSHPLDMNRETQKWSRLMTGRQKARRADQTD